MALETEVKIRITQEELDPIRARLKELGARCLSPRTEEKNLLLISPTETWRHAVAQFASALSEKRSP